VLRALLQFDAKLPFDDVGWRPEPTSISLQSDALILLEAVINVEVSGVRLRASARL
jgi:hypothetical protein